MRRVEQMVQTGLRNPKAINSCTIVGNDFKRFRIDPEHGRLLIHCSMVGGTNRQPITRVVRTFVLLSNKVRGV